MANINDLPNELLLMILDCLIASMSPQRRTVSRYFKHFNPLGIFSLVCRRLRAIALPFLYRDLEFDDWRDFANAISKFSDDAAYDPQCVRHVRVKGSRNISYIQIQDLVHSPLTVPFTKLVSFESLDVTSDMVDIQRLFPAKSSLESLAITWGDRSENALFMPLIAFPNLRRLRMHFDPPRRERSPSWGHEWQLPVDCTTSLTHLTLYDLFVGSVHVHGCLQNLRFPNLRVFNLQSTPENPSLVFDFVNRHPTLLELDVSFMGHAVRFECIPKLIDGTGTWRMPTDPEERIQVPGNILVDQATYAAIAEVPPEQRYPPNIEFPHLYCPQLAFSRRPLAPGTLTASACSIGSKKPRYEATGLALCILDQTMWPDGLFGDLTEIIPVLHRFFPCLEELRICFESPPEEREELYAYMGYLAAVLQPFKDLRRLGMHWRLRAAPQWYWSSSNEVWTGSLLDNVYPPSACDPGGFVILPTLREIGRMPNYLNFKTLREEVREELDIPMDELDEDDEQLIMKAWEVRNTHVVASAMRMLATYCPKLEEIEWYPHDNVHGSDIQEENSVRWLWKVSRNASGNVRLVTGHLSWTDQPWDNPPSFLIRVGEELQYLRQTAGRE